MEKLLYLSRADVEACALDTAEIIERLDLAFAVKGQGGVDLPPKPEIRPRPDSFLHAMPCYVSGDEAAGIKWVGAFPDNPEKGLPYISALVIMNDPDTGLPLAVMDGTWMTAWRTAAVSAISAQYLARRDSKVLAVCGAGVQGRTNLSALALVLKELEEVRIYDTSSDNLARYLDEMAPLHPKLKLKPAGSAQEAIRGADVVLTAGPIFKEPKPVIAPEWLKPGCLGLPLDFDNYFTPEAFLACHKFYTDDWDQLEYYHRLGSFPSLPQERTDLGDLAAAKAPGRENDEEIIMACNLGIAMDDMVVGALLMEKAKEKGLGTWLEL